MTFPVGPKFGVVNNSDKVIPKGTAVHNIQCRK